MMLKRIIILSLSVLLFVIAVFWNIYSDVEVNDVVKSDLKRYVNSFDSIDPKDSCFYDLEFLIEILDDKKVVLLGEQVHSDGSAFLLKSRLIKFLHQKMGFSVLLFEAGLYDAWLSNDEAIGKETDVDFCKFLYYFWCDVRETDDLLCYINDCRFGSNPLLFGGMDLQFTGCKSDSERAVCLYKYLFLKGIDIEMFQGLQHVFDESSAYTSIYKFYNLSSEQKRVFFEDVERVLEILEAKSTGSVEDLVYLRYLSNIKLWYDCIWKYSDPGNVRRVNLRDSIMADNVLWLQKNIFPDKKFIVWTSNFHAVTNNALYSRPFNAVSFGQRLKDCYGDSCYSVAITSFCDLNSFGQSCSIGDNRSFESLLHVMGYKYAFMDFTKIDSGSVLNREFITKINQKMDMEAKWTQMVDGIFYIDVMEVYRSNDE